MIEHSPDQYNIARRLDRWLKTLYPGFNQAMLEKMLRIGDIKVNGKRSTAGYRLQLGDKITLTHAPSTEEKKITIKASAKDVAALKSWIIAKEDGFWVFNKPAGIAVQGGSKQNKHLVGLLQLVFPEHSFYPVHRLDMATSGLLIVATNPKSARDLSDKFHNHEINKMYIALVLGIVTPKQGAINTALAKAQDKMIIKEDGKESLTKYKVLEYRENNTLLEVKPKTGRMHQIRIHLASINHPIFGDGKYGGKAATAATRILHLCAFELFFVLNGKEYNYKLSKIPW